MKNSLFFSLFLSLYFSFVGATFQIVRITSDRWKEYRALRLDALKNDSEAFALCFDDEKDLPESYWQQKLSNPFLFFAEKDGVLVGMVEAVYQYNFLRYCRHVITITGMYVDPEFRGKGIGYELMQSLLSKLENNSKPTMAMLTVITSRKPAISLYEKCGFKKSGVFENSVLVNGNYIDSFLMQKTLVR